MPMYSDSDVTRKPFSMEISEQDKVAFHFFNAVYAWMCVGLAVTGATAWLVSQNAQLVSTFNSGGIALISLLGMLGMMFAIQSAAQRLQPTLATVLFLLFSAFMGAVSSWIFVHFQLQTIAGAFVMTAGVFGGMSIYGFVTHRDLTALRSMLIMSIWGLILATIVNFFIASSLLYWLIDYAILAVFIGLTAADTQRLKAIAQRVGTDSRAAASYAIIGSLQLYLDFLNMFMVILNILGGQRR